MNQNGKSKMQDYFHSLLSSISFSSVLDLGCGSGSDLIRIASKQKEDKGRFYGIDRIEGSVLQARSKTTDPRVHFESHDFSQSIPFEDESFDLVYSINATECIVEKQKHLDEIFRVLSHDGTVILAHYDWDTQILNAKNKALTRKVLNAFSDWKQDWMQSSDGWMECFTFCETEYNESSFAHSILPGFSEMAKKGLIRQDEYELFEAELKESILNKEYFYSLSIYYYIGKKIHI